MKKTVAVFGTSDPSQEEFNYAFEVGQLLAEKGFSIVCGGLGGVMTGVCKGAKSRGGLTIGILPIREKKQANPYVDFAIPTGIGEARNVIVALSGDAAIAIGGGLGTLSEIALALKAGLTVVALSTWELNEPRAGSASFIRTTTPREAVERAVSSISLL